MNKIIITKKEQQAIKALHKVLNKWPETLNLFGWSGSLVIFKYAENGTRCLLPEYFKVSCDGGDPDDIDQNADIDYQ